MNNNDDIPLLGDLPTNEIADYLEEIGDLAGATQLRASGAQGQGLGGPKPEYQFTGVLVGFIGRGSGLRSNILNASELKADTSLRNTRLKVTLEQFYVHNYPGFGNHKILCDFAGENQTTEEKEEIKFATTLEAGDRQSAGVQGKPLFVGVTVGPDGLNFRGQTVNVCSDADDLVLDALGSDAFRQGLSLMTTAQPALKPFVGLATSVVKATLKRRKNKPVFKFDLGLDFTATTNSVRLHRGSYVIVQHNETAFDWTRFQFEPSTRTIIRKTDSQPLALNYLIIGIDDFVGPAAKTAAVDAKKK